MFIRENGAQKSVDELMISDLVFDPLAGKYVEIVDILSRTIMLERGNEKHPLHPVQLRAGCISKGRPTRDLLVSPSQVICHVVHSSNGALPFVQKSMASSIAGGILEGGEASCIREITYFAIFTDQSHTLGVSGILASSYEQNIFEADPTASGISYNVK